jgi:hypothetical protein
MKKVIQILFIVFLIFELSANATVYTVSNNPNSPGQFTSLQEAIDAASANDTIYVSGSTTSYGGITIVKKLTLIGAGYNPNNQFNFNSELNTIGLEIGMDNFGNPISNPTGTEIIGFKFHNIISYDHGINDIKLRRNWIISYINFYNKTVSGWVIRNNILNNVTNSNNVTNTILVNNIITTGVGLFKSNTISISNNIFTRSSGNAFSNVEYAIVANNIIYGMSTAGCNYCTFNNNISIGGSQTTFNYANNTGQNNLENVNPLFVSVGSTTFSFEYDYHLQESSPGHGAGTDGTDIGIYGGTYPFPSGGAVPWQTSPMPALPQVLQMNILNSVLPVNGTLQVQVQASSQP